MHDAVVVGGGPAGTITAGLLAKDHDIVVLEEHMSSGLPMQCAGLVTQDVLDMCGVSPDILNRIKGADVIFPGGGRFEVRSKDIKALLIDRTDLDKKLAEKAEDNGADIKYGVRYRSHRISDDGITLSTENVDLRSKLIIGADGQNSKVALSLGDNFPREYLHGIEADVKHDHGQNEVMTMRIGSGIAPGFFSWEIPFGDMMRVGLCISSGNGSPTEYLKKLLKVSGISPDKIVSKYAGKVPIGGRPRSYGERTLLIGDAAGQVKPVSAGGLYPICKAAPVLERTAKESILEDNFTKKCLSEYENGWKKDLGKELSRGYRIRKMFTNLSDGDLDKIFRIIDRDDTRSILDNIDLDRPSSIAYPMLKNPNVGLRFLPIMLRAII